MPNRDVAALECVQDGVAVRAVLPGKLVHASASLVLLANLRCLGGGEASLVAALALRPNQGGTGWVIAELPSLLVQTGQRGGLPRESFC